MSGTDFYYQQMPELARKLESFIPGGGQWKVFFGNSGTEAIEAALKLARYATGRYQFIAFQNSFHGRTMGSLSLTSSRPTQRRRFGPLVPGVTHIPYPDVYHCPLNSTPETAGEAVLRYLEEVVFRTTVPPGEVAAEELPQARFCDFGADDPRPEGDHVGVVVLAREARHDRVGGLHAADAAHLVGHDRLPGAASAQGDPQLVVAARNGARDRGDEVGVVDRVRGVGAEVVVLDPKLVEQCAELTLQGESRMVGSDRDAHGGT